MLENYGQSPWLDTIDRRLLRTGVLARLIADDGIKGLTSNPSIFQKAVCCSDDYDADIRRLAREGASTMDIYEALVVDDIRAACDLLAPVFEATNGVDGWVSVEVRPSLAKDAKSTVVEARRWFEMVQRRNVIVKIPGTVEGRPAIRQMISEGRPINVTLLFSTEQYLGVAHAYEEGLLAWAASGGDLGKPASVASIFVSRIDSLIDARLEALVQAATPAEAEAALALRGKCAVAGTKMAYQHFKREAAGAAMQSLLAKGGRVQRPLWASTSTKNPDYPDTLYVDTLIGPNTVNTLPMATVDAFRDHGTVAETLESDLDTARADLERLAELGISYEQVCSELQEEGIRLFEESFEQLIAAIETKRGQIAG